jgi:hypothetical protein
MGQFFRQVPFGAVQCSAVQCSTSLLATGRLLVGDGVGGASVTAGRDAPTNR